MDSLILHNERTIPLTESHLSPGQAGLLAGWGVFTTLRIYQGQPFEFHRHWQRMARDAARLNLAMIYEEEAVRRNVVRLAEANHRDEGMARVWLVRNQGGLWAGDAPGSATDLIVFTREIVPWPQRHRLLLQPDAIFSAGVLAGAKILSWAQNAMLFERARAQGFDDALLMNEKGELAECTSANIFLVRDGRVLTPPLSAGGLAGVTREVLLEIAPRAGIEIVEQGITPGDLDSAEEVFISSTTREVAGVSLIHPKWQFRCPGKMTSELAAVFKAYVRSQMVAAAAQAPSRGPG
jgi:branched-chain amino acid aminotransferase